MKVSLVLAGLYLSTLAYAGPGHDHDHDMHHSHDHKKAEKHGHHHGMDDHHKGHSVITAKETEKRGKEEINKLIAAKKIHGSWALAKYDSSTMKKFGNNMEWVVTFNNDKGEKGKRLYIFLKKNGEFVAANFTGK